MKLTVKNELTGDSHCSYFLHTQILLKKGH